MASTPDSVGAASRITLYWIPLGAGAGAGSRCVRLSGRAFEAAAALRQHRAQCGLYHAALLVHDDGHWYAIEMAPEWSGDGERGVVAGGAVGHRVLGRSRWFRYEVRRWPDGSIPDLAEVIAEPVMVPTDDIRVQLLLDLLPCFPTATWGRDELHTGDMWNSNSLVSWALAVSGHETATIQPPARGRAPGWAAGLAVAARQSKAGSPAASGVRQAAGRLRAAPPVMTATVGRTLPRNGSRRCPRHAAPRVLRRIR